MFFQRRQSIADSFCETGVIYCFFGTTDIPAHIVYSAIDIFGFRQQIVFILVFAGGEQQFCGGMYFRYFGVIGLIRNFKNFAGSL